MQFQTFSERVANLDIRKKAFYNIEHKNEFNHGELSYFCETLQKWRTINLTKEFIELDKSLSGIQTLAHLIHKHEYVGSSLISTLHHVTIDSLQAVLE